MLGKRFSKTPPSPIRKPLYASYMTSSPYITIYAEGFIDPSWLGDHSTRASLIFSKNLDYNKTLSRKRINIHLGEEERINTNGSIKSIWVKNIQSSPTKLGQVEKINAFLKLIYHSVLTIAEIEGWDTKPFEKAYELSVADNGNVVWYSKFKNNRSRNIKGRIKFSLDKEGKVPIVSEFLDSKLNIQYEIPIIDTFLHFVNWEQIFENPIWLDDEKFGFSFHNSQLLIFANIHLRKAETIISVKSMTQQEIEGRIRQLTYKNFENHDQIRKWANN